MKQTIHDIMIAAGFTCTASTANSGDGNPRVYYRAGADFPLLIVYADTNTIRIVRSGGSQEWLDINELLNKKRNKRMSVISIHLLAHEFQLQPGRVLLIGANDNYELWRLVNSGDLLMIDKKNRCRYAGPSKNLIGLAEAVERDHNEILEVCLP